MEASLKAQWPQRIAAWQMVAQGQLARVDLPPPPLAAGEVLVAIAGCGVCHTDLSFFHGVAATVQPPPLILGHEISGQVVAAATDVADWLGRQIVVPAVLPCRDCAICAMGRPNRCLAQKMPGNSLGVWGGFSSHIPLPARDLCPLPQANDAAASLLAPDELAQLAVVADAVTTPWQAAQRAQLSPGDCVIVIGAGGGVGGYMVQMAKALGARSVVGIDTHAARLAALAGHGLDVAIPCSGQAGDEAIVREVLRAHCRAAALPFGQGWKIFEASGTAAGQALALALLSFVGTLVVIGYGAQSVPFNLSRLMAFDAAVIGTWGCAPEAYPEVLAMCLDGRINLAPFVELQPMRRIHEVFAAAHAGELQRRVVLTPDF
jgi:6-hydroxycyclohex-1-ene-1-carbonyl-CoA dehydrogenase